MDNLLTTLKGEAFGKIFQDLHVSESCLRVMTWEQLSSIIPKELAGPAIIFFHGLKTWQNAGKLQTSTGNHREIDLPQILAKNEKATLIFKFFAKENRLDSKYRKLLSNIISEYMVINDILPKQPVLDKVAFDITTLFDCEIKETYFIKIKGKKPGGLLYSNWYNFQTKFKESSIRKNKENIPPSQVLTLADEVAVDLDWLKYNIEPREVVLEKWSNTYQWRFDLLKTNISLENVFEDFPILKQSFGYQLIEADFQKAYEGSSHYFDQWDTFKTRFVSAALLKIKDKQSLNILKSFNEQLEETQNLLVLLLMHAVLPPTARIKRSDKLKRLTVEDSRIAFVIWRPTVGEIETYLKEIIELRYLSKTTLQPIICLKGSSPYDITEYYLYVSSVFYKFDNILNCLDVCFKCFFVLNLKYPVECSLFWTFIQKFFYNIHLTTDLKSRSLSELLKELQPNNINLLKNDVDMQTL
ncbi:uncharacterized protein [Drosophila takahashii]|uniref:uncharacterized protein n=2 Tax=Drosophila takahashii TaxID=29030 RepID=UPI001CF91D58|nr:uncharacterized protein LOC123003305 [Drosophila takahashii]